MEILKVYFKSADDKISKTVEYAVSSWYCKPSFLCCIMDYFYREDSSAFMLTCSKYGCRQFFPVSDPKNFVQNSNLLDYKKDLPWIVFEFFDLSC